MKLQISDTAIFQWLEGSCVDIGQDKRSIGCVGKALDCDPAHLASRADKDDSLRAFEQIGHDEAVFKVRQR